MAEVLLGTVSSVAGITSLAIQAADGLLKLRKFCANVKSAPKELKQILAYLDILSLQINEILTAEESGENTFGGAPNLKASLGLCEQILSEIIALILQLELAIERNRTWGSVKKVMKDDDLKALKGRLEQAVNLLVASCVINGQKRITTSLIQIENMVTGTQTTSMDKSTIRGSNLVQTISFQSSNTKEITRPPSMDLNEQINLVSTFSHKISYKLRIPFSIRGRIIEFNYLRSISGWNPQFGLLVYNKVPFDSDIFILSRDADIPGVDALLRSGQASLYDVDLSGILALRYARLSHKPPLEVYKFWRYFRFEPDMFDVVYMTRYISKEDYAYGLFSEWVQEIDPESDNSWTSLLYSRHIDISERIGAHCGFHSKPLVDRLALVFEYDHLGSISETISDCMDLFRVSVGCAVTDTDLLDFIMANATDFLGDVIRLIGMACVDTCTNAVVALRKILSLAFNSGLDLTKTFRSFDMPPASLMECFMNGYMTRASHDVRIGLVPISEKDTCVEQMKHVMQFLDKALQIWLESLQETGFDLLKAGRDETKATRSFCSNDASISHDYGNDRWQWRNPGAFCTYTKNSFRSCQITRLDYGPCPKDWKAHYRLVLNQELIWEGMVSQFWELIRARRPPIPGAWRDWDDYDLMALRRSFGSWRGWRDVFPNRHWRKQLARALIKQEESQTRRQPIPSRILRYYEVALRQANVRKFCILGYHGQHEWHKNNPERWKGYERIAEIDGYFFSDD